MNVTHLVETYGYLGIFLLSVLQSCCVPTASEIFLGVAGVEAHQHHLSFVGAIGVAVAGEVVGALIAWVVGLKLGRSFVDRYGRFILLTHRDLDRAEAWYDRHPRSGVFGSRLLPVIRNFVALAAGIAEVAIVPFVVLTALGSLVWDGAMVSIGYGLSGSYTRIAHAFKDVGYVLAAAVVVLVVIAVVHRLRAFRADQEEHAARSDDEATV